MKLTNQKVLITGGSSGIGLSIAKLLLDAGNDVVITGRNEDKLQAVKDELPGIQTICCDMQDKGAARYLAEQVEAQLGGLTLLVNNAGIQHNFSFFEENSSDIDTWVEEEININFTSLVKLTSACLPLLKAAPSAAIVNVSSALAITPKTSAPVYCATKAAVHSFTRSLRYQCQESAPHIKVIDLLPPLVDTAMTEGRGKDKITPEQVAEELISSLEKGVDAIYVAKAKLLHVMHRAFPSVAAKIIKDS